MTEIICDNFAGGGGASTGIERVLGRVDVAINHSPEAIAIHKANHPNTKHWTQNICSVDPRDVTGGRPVGLAWFSPDCKDFSKAKGGAPVTRHIRDLAWVVIHWARLIRPRVICLENVEEFQQWGPIGDDGRPCPFSRGLTFLRWIREFRKCGYQVEWRELRGCDFGAPTIRKRLVLIARCDGRPIVWPAHTHGPGLTPYRTAAECIDWFRQCPSIFEPRARSKKPLVEATMRRICRGVWRYVIDAEDPFIVPCEHHLAAPFFVSRYGERPGQAPRCRSCNEPMATVVPDGNGAQLVAAFLAQHNRGATGHDVREPLSTITQKGSQQALVTSHILKLRNNCYGQDVRTPLDTIASAGNHFAEVRAFLTTYYSTDQTGDIREPLATCTTKDRFGLVTVSDVDFEIYDIGMRMLVARELYRAQGFPESYIIDPLFNGKPLSESAQKECCGNSVCPPLAEEVVRANVVLNEARPIPFRAPHKRIAVGQGVLL